MYGENKKMDLVETLQQIDDLNSSATGLYQTLRKERDAQLRRQTRVMFRPPLFTLEKQPLLRKQLPGRVHHSEDIRFKQEVLDTYLQTADSWLTYYDDIKKRLEGALPTNPSRHLEKRLEEQLGTFEHQLQTIKEYLEEASPPSDNLTELYAYDTEIYKHRKTTDELLRKIRQYRNNEPAPN